MLIKFDNICNSIHHYSIIMSKQLTHSTINENLEYASQSELHIQDPMWPDEYPLTKEQCIAAKLSSDTMHGWIRYNTSGGYCDLCSRAIGRYHRPACRFGNQPVGNLNDLDRAEPANESMFGCYIV